MSWSGDVIRSLRKMKGMTRNQFSSWTKIPVITLAQWENGYREPPYYVVRLLQDKMELDILRRKENKYGG